MTRNQKGFTLIELLIAITIIGIMMAAIMPFFRQQPGYERKQFVARLNALIQFAWQQAIITRFVHRVLFDFKERVITIERNTTRLPLDKFEFIPVSGPGARMQWPSSLVIQQFLVEGFDETKRFKGKAVQTVWFYIIPDGMTQQVTINGVDKQDVVDSKPKIFGLVLNPYLAQIKEYDAGQK